MRIDIRFLLPGRITKRTPPDWDEMSWDQRIKWAEEELNMLSDSQILGATSDFQAKDRKTVGHFDSSPYVQAVQIAETEETLWCTPAWSKYNGKYD